MVTYMKKRWIVLILIISALICFSIYVFFTFGLDVMSLYAFEPDATEACYFFFKFSFEIGKFVLFVFETFFTFFSFYFLISWVFKKKIKKPIRIIANVAFFVFVTTVFFCKVFTTPMAGYRFPLNDLFNFFSYLYSVLAVIGCLVSGVFVLFVYNLVCAIRTKNVQLK